MEDIISREVTELRKNAFGDDLDAAKSLPWSREQAWAVVRLLSRTDEASNVMLLHVYAEYTGRNRFHTTMYF